MSLSGYSVVPGSNTVAGIGGTACPLISNGEDAPFECPFEAPVLELDGPGCGCGEVDAESGEVGRILLRFRARSSAAALRNSDHPLDSQAARINGLSADSSISDRLLVAGTIALGAATVVLGGPVNVLVQVHAEGQALQDIRTRDGAGAHSAAHTIRDGSYRQTQGVNTAPSQRRPVQSR